MRLPESSAGFDPMQLARPEIRALTPYASARSLAGSSGILLNANESPFAPPIESDSSLNRYPDPQPETLKNRLAEIYRVEPDRLLITRGSDEGIDLLTRVFCRPNQDRVLICPPCFGMYALSARVQGAGVVESNLIEEQGEFALNPDIQQHALDCRLTFLCSPNNPTGNLISLDRIESLAQSQLPQGGLVIVDEAYIEFAPDNSALALQRILPNLVILRTLSKAHALAGCRIGVVIANPKIIELLRRIIAPYPLPTPTVEIALPVLSDDALNIQQQQLTELSEQKQRLLAALESHPQVRQTWPGAANFVLIRVDDAKRLIQSAGDAGIRLRDQSAQPGLDNCVRITIGSKVETTALIEFLETLNPS
ncbi:MAG: histidinol-phosphate transaminase [Pseudomonadota bacterium]